MPPSLFLKDDGIVDEIAVRRALDGHRVPLRRAEAREVLRRHVLERGGTIKSAGELLGLQKGGASLIPPGVSANAFFGCDVVELQRTRTEIGDIPDALRPSWRARHKASA